MAIPSLGTATNSTCNNASSFTATLPTHTTNDLLCLVVGTEGFDETEPRVTLTGVTGWTNHGEYGTTVSTAGSRHTVTLFTKKATSSSETDPTVDIATSDYACASAFVVSNVDADSPIANLSGADLDTNNTVQSISGVTTGTANSLAVTAWSTLGDSSPITVGGTGWSEASQTTIGAGPGSTLVVASKDMASTGSSGTVTFTSVDTNHDGAYLTFEFLETSNAALTANSIESASYVGSVVFGHELSADSVEATTEVGTPTLVESVNYSLTVTEIESTSYVGTPGLTLASNIFLTASDIESISYVGTPTLQDFFDFSDLGENYSFKRTIRIHDNATSSSDRTVKA